MINENKLERFEIIEKIGEGVYGTVFKVMEKSTQKFFALKKIKMDNENEGVPNTTIKEIVLLKDINHENIVKLYNIIHWNKRIFLVLEIADMDLKQFMLNQQEQLPLEIIKKIIFQLLKALIVLKNHQILHRDLKPQNILVKNSDSKNPIVKLADFGLARSNSLPSKIYTSEVVTLWYRAPELLFGCQNYGQNVDIWSLGCIFAELTALFPLFPGQTEIDQLKKIFNKISMQDQEDFQQFQSYSKSQLLNQVDLVKETRWEKEFDILGEKGLDLLMLMLQLNPLKRPTVEQLLEHSFFDEFKPENNIFDN